jgi:hypothetical protein
MTFCGRCWGSGPSIIVMRRMSAIDGSGQISGNNHAYLKSKSISRQSLSGCLLASSSNEPLMYRRYKKCLIQLAYFFSVSLS